MHTKNIIVIYDDELEELQSAILSGAFAERHAAFVAVLRSDKARVDHLDRQITALVTAGERVMHAVTEEEYMKKEIAERCPWMKMTSDEWIRAANFMESDAQAELEKAPGDFMRNHMKTRLHLAKAYYHADGTNQVLLRNQYGWAFFTAHMDRLASERKAG